MNNIFNKVFEVIGFVLITLSPILMSLLLSAILDTILPNTFGYIHYSILLLIGLVVGILWARSVWKKYGTINFLSRIASHQELDKKD